MFLFGLGFKQTPILMYKCVWTFPRLLCDHVEAQELVDMLGKFQQEDDLIIIGPLYVYKFSCLFKKNS